MWTFFPKRGGAPPFPLSESIICMWSNMNTAYIIMNIEYLSIIFFLLESPHSVIP